ncbi:MAG: chitobiase/beta-hexosaminidase C-terminal domain-containing protein [Bacteroidales bacterium]|nr:chitobiase/beta-hexosaminidase C-terminal domain-containing protein [Bacteroidales bacterium]
MDYANEQLTAARYRRGEVVLEEWQNGLRTFKADDPAPVWAEPAEPCACLTAARQASRLRIVKTGSDNVAFGGFRWHFDICTGYGWKPYTFGEWVKVKEVGGRVWLRLHEPSGNLAHMQVSASGWGRGVHFEMQGRWHLSGKWWALAGMSYPTQLLHGGSAGAPGSSRMGRMFNCSAVTGEVSIDGLAKGWFALAFMGSGIGRFSAPMATELSFSEEGFAGCGSLTSFSAPCVVWMGAVYMLFRGTRLRELVLPAFRGQSYDHTRLRIAGSLLLGVSTLRRLVLPRLDAVEAVTDNGLPSAAVEYVRMGNCSAWEVTLPTADGRADQSIGRALVLHAGATLTTPTGWTRLTDTPAITASGSDYSARRTVSITTDLNAANVAQLALTHTTAADIYYTTDGTEPSATNGKHYTDTFTIEAAAVIKAIAINTEGEEHLICQSDVASASFETLACLTFTATVAGSTVSLVEEGTMTYAPALEYSTDGGATWQTLSYSSAITLANVGDFVHVRATQGTTNVFWESSANRAHFAMTGGIEASGSVLSLIDADWCDDTIATGLTQPYQLAGLFFGCGAALLSAPDLPAVTATEGCYYAMFEGCTALTGRVRIRLTALDTLSCARMFYGCASLHDIWADFAVWTADGTTDWVDGVNSQGMFTDQNLTDLAFGASGIPDGWSYRHSTAVFMVNNVSVTSGNIECD